MIEIASDSSATDALRVLIELERAATTKYEYAADKLARLDATVALDSFRAQHVAHAKELGEVLEQRQSLAPAAANETTPLADENPILRDEPDQRQVLFGLRRAEEALEALYVSTLERGDLERPMRELLERLFAQQRRCTVWLEDELLVEENRT